MGLTTVIDCDMVGTFSHTREVHMLQREAGGSPTRVYGFTVDVEVDATAPSPEQISCKMSDSLAWVEGCGEVNVTYLGQIDTYDSIVDAEHLGEVHDSAK